MVLFVDYRMIMIIEAIALTALLSRRPLSPPAVTCHKGTVSYEFVGVPGVSFGYRGETYSIPKSGSIELIADGGETSYQIAERRQPLEACPIDGFGTRTVALPKAEATMGR